MAIGRYLFTKTLKTVTRSSRRVDFPTETRVLYATRNTKLHPQYLLFIMMEYIKSDIKA
jgi:hypothetical protein